MSEEESVRTVEGALGHYAIRPMLPELAGGDDDEPALTGDYSSAGAVMELERLAAYLLERLGTQLQFAPVVNVG